MKKEVWIPIVLQILVFGGVLWGYATTSEHRMTVVEQSTLNLDRVVMELAVTQREQALLLQEQNNYLQRLLALEEVVHGTFRAGPE